jgi:CheY-like chemotaxis protein
VDRSADDLTTRPCIEGRLVTGRSRVLVIDDSPEIREVLRDTLELQGYDVVLATDGAEGLWLHRQRPADLVITDIFMPEKDGIEIILELAKEFPAVKVIAISGGGRMGNFDYLPFAEQFGALRVLPKPFRNEELLEAVRSVLAS